MHARPFLIITVLLTWSSFAHAARLLNGPMPGTSTMHAVKIWVQTDAAAEVYAEYTAQGTEDTQTWRTDTVTTEKNDGYAAILTAYDGIEPGLRYDYSVYVDGVLQTAEFHEGSRFEGEIPMTFQSKPRWRFIPDEEADVRHSIFDFRIAMGSCVYINEPGTGRETGAPYGAHYEIFESVYSKQPDLMLWVGDTIYYRGHDYGSRLGLIHRWTHHRQTPEMRALLANAQHFATWDDHDYGPNDIGASYPLKDTAKDVFDLMWANPSSGTEEIPGIFTFFNWGDVNVYMLDNRFYLTTAPSDPEPFGKPKSMLGEQQVDWLVEHLAWAQSQMRHDGASYPARFNLICVGNQVLNTSGNIHGYQNFPEEYQYLIDRIVHERINGVVFLTGDVHFGEVNRLDYKGGGKPGVPGKAGMPGKTHTLLEITSSPMTSGAWAGHSNNSARYDIFPGEMDRVGERNFVTLDFKGPLKERRMEIRYWDVAGNLLNQAPDGAEGEVTEDSIILAKDLWAPRP